MHSRTSILLIAALVALLCCFGASSASYQESEEDNDRNVEVAEWLRKILENRYAEPESEESDEYQEVKRALPMSGSIYGKRGIPLSGGLYGKRWLNMPTSGSHGYRWIPASKSSSTHEVLARAVPMSGGMYGKRGVPYSGGLYG